MVESALLNLKRGMRRQEAHSLIREISIKSELEGKPFRDALLEKF